MRGGNKGSDLAEAAAMLGVPAGLGRTAALHGTRDNAENRRTECRPQCSAFLSHPAWAPPIRFTPGSLTHSVPLFSKTTMRPKPVGHRRGAVPHARGQGPLHPLQLLHPSAPRPRRSSAAAFSAVKRLSAAGLHGRAERVTAQTSGSRPGRP
jgi:hypothetical protein